MRPLATARRAELVKPPAQLVRRFSLPSADAIDRATSNRRRDNSHRSWEQFPNQPAVRQSRSALAGPRNARPQYGVSHKESDRPAYPSPGSRVRSCVENKDVDDARRLNTALALQALLQQPREMSTEQKNSL